jgi:glycosyltransferase involved in cell wall biosynthesis
VKEVVSAIGCLGETNELWLMGDWESEEFRLECSSVAGFARCRHLGYLPLSHVYGRLKQADVGLAVLHPEKSYLRAIPTKAFDYMATSLPVIMSDFPLWRRLFHDCALFVNPLDTEDIAEKMTTLARNPDLRLKLGTAGRRRVESQCSWEAEVPKLIRLYERLVGQGAPGR